MGWAQLGFFFNLCIQGKQRKKTLPTPVCLIRLILRRKDRSELQSSWTKSATCFWTVSCMMDKCQRWCDGCWLKSSSVTLIFSSNAKQQYCSGGFFLFKLQEKNCQDAWLMHAFLTMCCLSQYLWTCLGSNSATRLMTSRENLNLIGGGGGGGGDMNGDWGTKGLRSSCGLTLPFSALVWLVAFGGVVRVRWSVIHLKGGEETGC